MEYIEYIGTQEVASDEIIRSDGVIYTFDHTTQTDENGSILHICKGWFLTPFDLESIHNGNIPKQYAWDQTLHKQFRQYQHRKADDLYVLANRMIRAGDSRYEGFLKELDQYNQAISATQTNLSTDIPELPELPRDS